MSTYLNSVFFRVLSLKEELQGGCIVLWEEKEGHNFELLGNGNRTNDIILFIVRIVYEASVAKQPRHVEVNNSVT